MPGSIPATSQLDWLISTTAIIVLSWSRATRDLLKSFGWGIGALHRFTQRRWCHLLAACPIATLGPTVNETPFRSQPHRQSAITCGGPSPSRRSKPRHTEAASLKSAYYAYSATGGITFTFGGLRVDENAQVIATDWRPITGLFP